MDIVHLVKTILLFYTGQTFKNVLLGDDHGYLVSIIYYPFIALLLYKFICSYKPSKILENTDFTVCIVGAGFSGIGAAIKLKEIGVKFRIIEKDERLGGTWWENQYPGCACDIPSFLYSYSFDQNPDWSESYSPQPEILKYMERVADKYDIRKHIELGKKVTNGTWDKYLNKWKIQLNNGETFYVNAVVSGVGGLHVPSVPEFKGQQNFKGDAFHSSRWPKDYEPNDKRVAVIGTGASAVQVVPNIAEKVKHLYVFQRTPCWCPPKLAVTHTKLMASVFKLYPPLMYLLRMFYFWRNEFRFATVFRMEGIFRKRVIPLMKQHINSVVKDQELAKKLTPNFELGCKRITPSDNYLQSFNRSNVTLVTQPIQEFTKTGIKTTDNKEYNVESIIYATGFSIIESGNSVPVVGMDRKDMIDNELLPNGTVKTSIDNKAVSLQEEWGERPNAYKGIVYPGFPNFFMLLGPGTGLGHNSAVYMIECQITYVVDAIRKLIEKDMKYMHVKKSVNETYQKWVQECMQNKVFNSQNCKGWYKNSKGIAYTLWPSHLTHYWWTTKSVDLDEFICVY